jgi:hypothetical protein
VRIIFSARRKTGHFDLEAIEMAVRSSLHQAGATALSELLRFASPATDRRILPCSCGHQAHYHEQRSKLILTVVGPVEVSRPYYWCPQCHNGQFPADVELDIENTGLSPGVRHMLAMVGQQAAFEFRRQQLFIGTGVIEAGCKTVIGSRCKQSGMFWTVRGANAIVALRCCQFNNRFEDYWEGRRA